MVFLLSYHIYTEHKWILFSRSNFVCYSVPTCWLHGPGFHWYGTGEIHGTRQEEWHKILVQELATLTDDFCGFPQSLQPNTRTQKAPQIRSQLLFLPQPFYSSFTNRPTMQFIFWAINHIPKWHKNSFSNTSSLGVEISGTRNRSYGSAMNYLFINDDLWHCANDKVIDISCKECIWQVLYTYNANDSTHFQ